MKTLGRNSISVLFLLGTSYLTLFAQSDNNLKNTPVPQSRYNRYFSFLLDSSVRYEYYSENDSSPLEKSVYKYDGEVQKNSQINLLYGSGKYWENSEMFIWTYDEAGNITSVTKSNWDRYDKKWVYDSMEIWKYNYSNRLTLNEKWEWSIVSDKWIGSDRKKYQYDDKDSLVLIISSRWDEGKHNWTDKNMDLYDYDDQGNKILQRHYSFSEVIKWYIFDEQIRTYDTAGHMTVEQVNCWNFDNSLLEPWYREEFEFNDNGDRILRIHYSWNSSTRQLSELYREKWEYIYDEAKNILSCIEYFYYNYDNIWNEERKWEYEYDSNNNLIMSSNYYWQPNLSIWTGEYKEEWRYDERNNLIRWDRFGWDSNSNQWGKPDFLNRYIYDEANKLITHLEYKPYCEYQWVTGHEYICIKFDMYYKHEYFYDGTGRDTLYKSVSKTDSTDWYDWECEPKTRKVYDNNGNLIVITEEESYKNEFGYNDSGLLLLKTEYFWDGSTNEWWGYKKWEEVYSDRDLILCHSDFKWDNLSKSWNISERAYFYWSQHEVNTPVISENQYCILYPNPSDGIVRLELSKPAGGILDVFTADGRKALTIPLINKETIIDLTDLNPGIYLFFITSDKNRFSYRVVIE